MLRQTPSPRFAVKLVASLAVLLFLLVRIGDAAPNAAKDAPGTPVAKIATNPKPVPAEANKELTPSDRKREDQPVVTPITPKGVTTTTPKVVVAVRQPVPLSKWTISDKVIKGCPVGETPDDDGACRPSAG